MYQRVSSGPEAMTGSGARQLDILVYVLLVSFLVPALLTIAELVIARVSKGRADLPFHAVVLALLAAILVWQQLDNASGFLRLLIPLAVVALFAFGYLRTEFLRNFAMLLAIATPVVIVLFALSYPVKQALTPQDSPTGDQSTEATAPVVLVLLDELPLASLMDADRHVDGRFFPRLSQIERESTWYRSALSVADQTIGAAPAILTGQDPPADVSGAEPVPPGVADYPDTLCTVTERAGYDVYALELITDLCHRYDDLPARVSSLVEQSLPARLPEFVPEELRRRNPEDLTPEQIFENAANAAADLFPFTDNGYGIGRDQTILEYIDGMPMASKSVSVLHVALPHVEYQYLPDGRNYVNRYLNDVESAVHAALPVNARESGKNLQQLTSQMMYTDRILGKIVDRMKAAGIWDESLLVVTSDHGASFRLGVDRRALNEKNAGWLMPVPLFIKYPDQTRGEIVDADVDSRDITPTILSELGLEPSPTAAGRDLRSDDLAPRLKATAVRQSGPPLTLPLQRIRTQLDEAVDFRNRLLASGELNAIGGHPEMLGERIADRTRFEKLDFESEFYPSEVTEIAEEVGLPAYFQADLPGVTRDPGPLAITIDGRVAATARAWKRADGTWMTGVNVIPDDLKPGPIEAAVYAIRPRAGGGR